MTEMKKRVKSVYSDYGKFIAALKLLATKSGLDMEVFSPMPLHDVEKILPQKPSPVRWFTFVGGLLGMSIGFGFPIYTVLQWPLITGGKPVVTIQVFIIIAFELLILFGAIFTLIGLLITARLPRGKLANYDTRFSENSFGMIIRTDPANVAELRDILKQADDLAVDDVEVLAVGANA
ncbi:MAG: DUF3341 domain-containing protein [Candidatus Zhuqueibacterota bacterium]